jgi:hypothetical protein
MKHESSSETAARIRELEDEVRAFEGTKKELSRQISTLKASRIISDYYKSEYLAGKSEISRLTNECGELKEEKAHLLSVNKRLRVALSECEVDSKTHIASMNSSGYLT